MMTRLGTHPGTQIFYDISTSCIQIYGNTFEDITKGRELFLDVLQIATFNVFPLKGL
jgi:hypothetical protein